MVDGCENTVWNYLTQKFHEVQKDITVSYHAHLQYAVIVNSKFWNGLPADIPAQLEKAMDEATDYTNSIVVKENEDALGFLALVNILLLPAGNFMEPTSIILIMAPILAPAAKRLGIDLVHFGIVIDCQHGGRALPPAGQPQPLRRPDDRRHAHHRSGHGRLCRGSSPCWCS